RKWAELSLNQTLDVRPYTFNPNIQYIAKIVLEVDFLDKKTTLEPYDTEKMATEYVRNFCKQAFTVGQMINMEYFSLNPGYKYVQLIAFRNFNVRHVEVTTSTNRKYVFTLKGCAGFPSGQIGFSLPMLENQTTSLVSEESEN
ncbi:vesicle-fusing ATPase 1, partial [Nephila pilipes]